MYNGSISASPSGMSGYALTMKYSPDTWRNDKWKAQVRSMKDWRLWCEERICFVEPDESDASVSWGSVMVIFRYPGLKYTPV